MSVTIVIPAPAEKILRILNSAGHEAYVVGGCVRDALLGREPGDWDITTSAHPEEIKALFSARFHRDIRDCLPFLTGREKCSAENATIKIEFYKMLSDLFIERFLVNGVKSLGRYGAFADKKHYRLLTNVGSFSHCSNPPRQSGFSARSDALFITPALRVDFKSLKIKP